MTAESISRAWSWRKAVTRSGLMPTTRHVLLTLSLHMNEHGEGCYPPVEDLVTETGLSKRAVLEHLNKAIEAGWLVRQELGLRGRRWRRSEYQPAWPGRDIVAEMDDPGGDDGRSPPPPDEVVTQDARGGDPNDAEVVTEDHHVREESRQESTNSPVEREARAGEGKKPDPRPEDDHDFQKLLAKVARTRGPQPVGRCFPLWLRLDPPDRGAALADYDQAFAAWHDAGQTKSYGLETYLRDRMWAQLPKRATGEEIRTLVKPRTDEWFALFWRRRKAGERVTVMLDQAKGGGAWSCAIDSLPGAEEIAGLAEIEVGSEQFRAWSTHLAKEGLRLGGEACGKFIRVPSEWPPGTPEQRKTGPPESERYEEREAEGEAGEA